MKAMVRFVGMTAGGWVGWFMGEPISIYTAFMVSMLGTGIGLYYTQKLIKRYLP